jgi:hypothetical protein
MLPVELANICMHRIAKPESDAHNIVIGPLQRTPMHVN